MYDDPDDAASYYRELEAENERCRKLIMDLSDEVNLAVKALKDAHREVREMSAQLAQVRAGRVNA